MNQLCNDIRMSQPGASISLISMMPIEHICLLGIIPCLWPHTQKYSCQCNCSRASSGPGLSQKGLEGQCHVCLCDSLPSICPRQTEASDVLYTQSCYEDLLETTAEDLLTDLHNINSHFQVKPSRGQSSFQILNVTILSHLFQFRFFHVYVNSAL